MKAKLTQRSIEKAAVLPRPNSRNGDHRSVGRPPVPRTSPTLEPALSGLSLSLAMLIVGPLHFILYRSPPRQPTSVTANRRDVTRQTSVNSSAYRLKIRKFRWPIAPRMRVKILNLI
jgi:hypothetical protein